MQVKTGLKRGRNNGKDAGLQLHLCSCLEVPLSRQQTLYYLSPSVASEEKFIEKLLSTGCTMNPSLEAPFVKKIWHDRYPDDDEEEEEEDHERDGEEGAAEERGGKSGRCAGPRTKKLKPMPKASDFYFCFDDDDTDYMDHHSQR